MGQTLIEFALSSTAVLLTLTAAGWVLRAHWDRARCAYLTFETTHAELIGKPRVSIRVPILIQETPEGYEGSGACGKASEKVSLRKIEPEFR